MKKSVLIILVCLGVVAAVIIAIKPSQASDNFAGSTADPAEHTRLELLKQSFEQAIAAAREKGSVRLIVGVRADFTPEGYLTEAQKSQQRFGIKQAQNAFLTRYESSGIVEVHSYEFIPFLSLEAAESGLTDMQDDPAITSINEDIAVPPSLAESTQIVQAPAAWNSGFDGSGWAVAILDSGVNKNHTFLTGKVVSEACYSSTVPGFATSLCPGGVPESTAPNSGLNCDPLISGCPHGTHVAGITAGSGASFSGTARNAKIIAIQVFSRFDNQSNCGSTPAPCVLTYPSDYTKGLERVLVLNGSMSIASANMSLGGGQFFDQASCDLANPAVKAAIDNLRSVNIATVISSGNNGYINSMGSPGCISSAVSVGSTDDGSLGTVTDRVSDFSNSASFLNLLAPGRWVNSSVAASGSNSSFSNYLGTSMAAPHVAGAWAILKQRSPGATVSTILNALITTGQPITDFRTGLVKPRIRINSALQSLGGETPTATPTSGGTPSCTPRSFSNTGFIAINDSSPASPYPSNIVVSGVTGSVAKVTIDLTGINHTYPDDIDIMLVGPAGQNAMIMSDAGDNFDITNVSLTLDDAAATVLPDLDPIGGGAFRPANYEFALDVFPVPAPVPSGNSALSVFNGTNPNGIWSLYVLDDAGVDFGSISGGWRLHITTNTCGSATPTATATATRTSTNTPTFTPTQAGTPSCTPRNFSNTSAIMINDNAAGSPYPSNIFVSGVSGSVTKVTVDLLNMSHTFPDDVDVMLVGPGGQNVMIMSDAGGGGDIVSVNLTFDSFAGSALPDATQIFSGTFQPSNYDTNTDVFPAPAPPPSGSAALSAFNGTNPNGTWSLYVRDDLGIDLGSISGGWALRITTSSCGTTATNTPTRTSTHTPTNTPTFTPTNAPTATASPTCTPGGAFVLYDQTSDQSGGGTSSQDFEPSSDAFDDRAADDFQVPNGQTWTIQKVVVKGSYNGSGAASAFNVRFYRDFFNGTDLVPGDPIAGGTFTNVGFTNSSGTFTIQLPSSVVLTQGFYWVSVQARMNFNPDGQWFWTDRLTPTFAPATWQNPGGGLSIPACLNWAKRAATCGINAGAPEQIFQIIGTNGSGGGCGSARTAFDYDGDRKSDMSVFRPSNGTWYVQGSQVGFYGLQFGLSTDRITPADFDGDGKTDIAVYRPSQGLWAVLNSGSNTVSYTVFGAAADLPTPADYDGDLKADISVFRPSNGTWYRLNSGSGNSFFGVQFGLNGDKPTIGDFDGDGRSDIAVWRPSSGIWYRLNSSNSAFVAFQFGVATDLITPADYDGDGKTDYAVYRSSSGVWYRINSSDGAFVAVEFGLSIDIPTPGDFDGDGRADICVWRPTDGTWYRLNSSNGQFVAFQFGTNGDRPTQAAFRY
ncbi:MAG: S8 family serine peptidase [Pyrinomonadaceae bacterium]